MGENMVYWTCTFKLPTKKASSFLIALKRAIREKCGFEWTISKDVGKRITKVYAFPPTFSYRVDLRTPWSEIAKAQEKFDQIIGETKQTLLDVAEKFDAKVEVYVDGMKSVFVSPSEIRKSEEVEKKATKILANALKKIKKEVDSYEILTIDSIVAEAKRRI